MSRCSNLEVFNNLIHKSYKLKPHNNIQQAKILFKALLNATLDSSMIDYKSFANNFIVNILSLEGEVNKILESFKADIMNKNTEDCYVLAKVYEIGFFNQPKDEYNSMLLTLIGYKLGNRDCRKIIESEPSKYTILEYTANNFIENYLGKNLLICLDDAISSAHLPSLYNSAISDGYDNSYGNGYNFSSHDYIHSSDLLGN